MILEPVPSWSPTNDTRSSLWWFGFEAFPPPQQWNIWKFSPIAPVIHLRKYIWKYICKKRLWFGFEATMEHLKIFTNRVLYISENTFENTFEKNFYDLALRLFLLGNNGTVGSFHQYGAIHWRKYIWKYIWKNFDDLALRLSSKATMDHLEVFTKAKPGRLPPMLMAAKWTVINILDTSQKYPQCILAQQYLA